MSRLTDNQVKAAAKAILNITASYAEVAYGWEILEEEDVDDYVSSIHEILKKLGADELHEGMYNDD